jgi:phosphoenolpyruvate carboxykinase (ATP)
MNVANLYSGLNTAQLIEQSVLRGEGQLTNTGALLVTTGHRTGRSPADRFIVRDGITDGTVDWGAVNRPFGSNQFSRLWLRVLNAVSQHDRFGAKLHVGANADHYEPVTVISETAWQCLFANNMFVRPGIYNPVNKPEWTVLTAPSFVCDPERDSTQSDAALIINFTTRQILLAGLRYAGELKKAMFSVQNFLLPERDVLPMHCSANVGEDGDTCLFFGLSGTGKTTLSADSSRYLIGDDEHAWAQGSVFNLEGGCYAKTIDLSQKNEPIIWDAIRFGAIVENVVMDPVTRHANYSDTRLSENGRCCYPLEHVERRMIRNAGGEPKTLIFLTCDVSGTLPPVAILSKEAAAFHFLSGYTARVGSTEVGATAGIQPTFSTCFGAPFMPRPAAEYAELLMKRIEGFGSRVYLVNTGWTGGSGAPGGTGKRFPIPVTRAIVSACQCGELMRCNTEYLHTMNLEIPKAVTGVDPKYLNPRNAWADSAAYDDQAAQLARLFVNNIAKFNTAPEVVAAGPRI